MDKNSFSNDVLRIDPAKETEKISQKVREILTKQLRRRGAVVGLSGGIDSSVTVALMVKALGSHRVSALLMPEKHSSRDTLEFSEMIADHFGIAKASENISDILESVGFYQRYNNAVRQVIPEYNNSWQSKIVSPNILREKQFNLFSIVAQAPDGAVKKARLSLQAYLAIVAATNFKQRVRKMLEYYYADLYNYAVVGTPNRLEYDQGFFVKNGDGSADIKPIAHLYKTQVYQLAEYLDIPEAIRKRPPTTDTYSMSQGQDEFYFSLPFDKMDMCLYAKNHGVSADMLAEAIDLTAEQVQRVFNDIDTKRNTTRYLHLSPLLIESISEIGFN